MVAHPFAQIQPLDVFPEVVEELLFPRAGVGLHHLGVVDVLPDPFLADEAVDPIARLQHRGDGALHQAALGLLQGLQGQVVGGQQ